MLTAYQAQLQALIQAPSSPVPLVPVATQTTYINMARNQLAADAECLRTTVFLTLATGRQNYTFAEMDLTGVSGYGVVIAVRSGLLNDAPLEFRPYEWFQAYYFGNSARGIPTLMAQLGQGTRGSLAFWPTPADHRIAVLDVACLPIPLVNDSTPEAIPDLWRDAVPFYAAWLAHQSLQRQNDAELMLRRYALLSRRGRQLATPSELPENLPGGRGTQMAAQKTTLGQPAQATQQQPQR